jgi:hypothetical protein
VSLLFLGIVLLVIGGVMAYFGRRSEHLLYIGGVIVFIVGLVIILYWALTLAGDSDVDADLLIGAPALLFARRW